jgi:hypothetical protein
VNVIELLAFFSPLYHAHVHKPTISQDYVYRLTELARRIGLLNVTEDTIRQPEQAAGLIGDFLKGQGYCMTRPHGIPAYNMSFASLVTHVPTVYHDRITLFDDIAALSRFSQPPAIDVPRIKRGIRRRFENAVQRLFPRTWTKTNN